ncbi:hypothetical protein C8J56DRAFT_590221 [Mycena floridula]|nr:hypothetical protein C8J56DRAFT_590221 [Mycena floridula]
MRFSITSVFVIAVAALSIDAAAIPQRRNSLVSRMEPVVEARAVVDVPQVEARAIPEVAPVVARDNQRLHARDFKRAARSVPEEAAPVVARGYKRLHARDFRRNQ